MTVRATATLTSATVWMARLEDVEIHMDVISEEERQRAARFRFERDARRYLAARTTLRELLALHVDAEPRDLDLALGQWGKPWLRSDPQMFFNVAHSEDLALFAFSRIGQVGVDVEFARSIDPVSLAATCFSEREREEMLATPPAERLDAFFRGWVRKEAIVKADGRGFSERLDTFTVSLSDPVLLSVPPPDPPGARWELATVDVGGSAHAAVALLVP